MPTALIRKSAAPDGVPADETAPKPGLRLLALAADIDMGGNTPIDFLLEGSDIELLTLYVVKGVGLPESLPEHDVAIVVASDSEECRDALALIEKAAPHWPRPLLNRPDLIGNLDRDKLYRLLADVPGLRLVRDGEADAFVSAGHSGATMAGALFILRKA